MFRTPMAGNRFILGTGKSNQKNRRFPCRNREEPEMQKVLLLCFTAVFLTGCSAFSHMLTKPVVSGGKGIWKYQGIYTVQPAEILKKYGTAVVIAWGMFIGGIALSITAKPWEQPVKVDIVVIVFLLLIVLLGSIFAFLFYLSGVGIIGPTKASMIACIEPVVATICSVVFLGNPFSFLDAIGFAFILSTVFIVAYISDRENKKNTTQ